MKKNHHYIPQVYLKYFTDKNKKNHEDKFLWVFKGPTAAPYRKSPKNICAEKYFYSFDDDELEPDYELIENYFNGIETSVSKVLNDLYHGKPVYQDARKRVQFARFVCFLHYRTAQSREFFRIHLQNIIKSAFVDEMKKAGGYKEWAKKKNEFSEMSEEDFLNSFNGIKIVPKKVLAIDTMLQTAFKMIPFFVERNWTFYFPKHSEDLFVTSDHPVILLNKNFKQDMMPGFALEETDFIFPVNSRLCLVASFFTEERYVEASREQVIGFNRVVANKSYKYVFGGTNDFAKLFGDAKY